MRPRTIGRRLALQYLFMADINRYDGIESPAEFFAGQREAGQDAPEGGGDSADSGGQHQTEAEAFAQTIITEVIANAAAIDAEIEKAAQNWTLVRMGVIERNVIRIAAAELRLETAPRATILDEAVELAKRFGDDESGAFVNGVADRLGKTE